MPDDLPRRIGGLGLAVRLLCLVSAATMIAAALLIYAGKGDAAQTRDEMALWAFAGSMGLLALVYLAWSHAAVTNARAMRPDARRIGPWMAVGWWFVPVSNFFQPVRVMSQTWNTSVDGTDDINGAAAAPVAGWWMLAAIATLTGPQAFLLLLAAPTAEAALAHLPIYGIALLSGLGMLGCLSASVKRISAAQSAPSIPAAQAA